MYYITVEICNEASCSTPAQASLLVEKGTPLQEQCVTHAALAVHDHLTLEFEFQGEVFQTPANMGIDTSVCLGEMHVIHTHALDDVLHLELHEDVPVFLSLFFEIWNISYPQSTQMNPLFLMPENVSIYVGDVLYGGTFDTLQLTNGQSIKVIFYSNIRIPTAMVSTMISINSQTMRTNQLIRMVMALGTIATLSPKMEMKPMIVMVMVSGITVTHSHKMEMKPMMMTAMALETTAMHSHKMRMKPWTPMQMVSAIMMTLSQRTPM